MKYLIPLILTLMMQDPKVQDIVGKHHHLEIPNELEIEWCAEEKLNWNDFAGEPEAESVFHAVSATYIEVEHTCKKGQDFDFNVRAVFVKDMSWSVDKKSAELLAHEQVHFDITEYYARKVRRQLDKLEDPCFDQAKVKQTIDQLYQELESAHHLYDQYTMHGLKEKEQDIWADVVAEGLNELEDYRAIVQ